MREILFRGKRKDNGEWVEGDSLIHSMYKKGDVCIGVIEGLEIYSVIPETVGQYTGLTLTDKNRTKIFEGDIVNAQDDIFGSPFCFGITGKVVFEETAFFIAPENPMEAQWLFNECAIYEVIGNIHDNPELLKGGAENEG